VADLTYAPPAIAFVETPAAPAASPATLWSPLTRIAFRFTFVYFLLYALCCGNATIWEVIPRVGGYINDYLAWPFRQGSQWVGQHLFHLTSVAGKLHGGGSGDRALDWIAVGIMLVLALLATLIWTARDEFGSPDRHTLAYPRLFRWFRFIIRLTLGVAMLNYGFVKVFPLQMGPPLLAVLNEPLGNTSPMTMLWTLIGLNPVYEAICGATEVISGSLILFRRTALVGALLTAFVTTNIVLYNFCFDVPVKIYAAHLLLMSLVLVTPEIPALFGFFWQHVPSRPSTLWSPFTTARPTTRLRRWISETTITAAVVIITVTISVTGLAQAWLGMQKAAAHPSAFTGQWHLTSATLNGKPTPYLTGDGIAMTDLFLEPSGRAMVRSSDNVLWRAGAHFDDKKHTANFGSNGHKGGGPYAYMQPDPTHLVLTPTGDAAKTEPTLDLTRVPLPTTYPLLTRGFHFINEWGLER
jgi:hypothetical protein